MEGAESDADEDEDYMSEAFLKGLEDVRPGLLTKTQKRKKKSDERHEMSKALPKRKVIKIAESEARQHALSTPISSSSKGYSLLQKMGYKEGTGLGKSGKGPTSLIPLVLKEDKYGLGRRSFLKEKESQKQIETKKTEEISVSEFRKKKQAVLSLRKAESDLKKSQLACEQLDREAGIVEPHFPWFWRCSEEENEEDGESIEEEEVEPLEACEQLVLLTEYLRTVHFYCIWCGNAYNDEDDMNGNCPGDTEEPHNN